MKKGLLIAVLLVFVHKTYSQIVFFKGTFEEAKAQAKKDKKQLFVDCYTTWCGPCKMLDRNVFSNPDLGKFINENYIPLKLDMEREGVLQSEAYRINSYPTMLILDAEGNEKSRIVGYRDASQLMRMLNSRAQQATSEMVQVYKQKYDGGQRDMAFLKTYIDELAKANRSIEMPFNDYLDQKKEAFSKDELKWIFDISSYYNATSTRILMSEKAKVIEVVGKESYQSKMEAIVLESGYQAGKMNDKTTLEDLINFCKQNNPGKSRKWEALAHLGYAEASKDFEQYAEKAYYLFNNFEYGNATKFVVTIRENCTSENCKKIIEKLEKKK